MLMTYSTRLGFATLAFAFLLAVTYPAHGASTSVANAAIPTTRQGMHALKTGDGQLFMVAGTYQDTTTYRRSLAFYFQGAKQTEWQHVPIVEGKVDYVTEWFSASRGETTLRDAVLLQHGDSIQLVIAEKPAGQSRVTVARYKFTTAGDDYPDGPGYLFVPASAGGPIATKARTVEEALAGETAKMLKRRGQ